LLEINSAEKISFHEMRGALFETWVISELIKLRFNKGENSNLFFWRDKTGNEVDVIIETASKLTPVEIKSSETISQDFFKGLKYWSNLAKDKANKPLLIYGGNSNQNRTNVDIISWTNIVAEINI